MKNYFASCCVMSCVVLSGCQLNPLRWIWPDTEQKQTASAQKATQLQAKEELAAVAQKNTKQQPSVSFFSASGTYRCEQDEVLRIVRDQELPSKYMQIGWNDKQYTLLRVHSTGSGLPRFSDAENGLEWIDLPWKGVLLNSHTQKPIVSECKVMTAAQQALYEQQQAQEQAQKIAKAEKDKKKKPISKKKKK